MLSGQAQVLRAFGNETTFLLTGKETGGKYTMFLDVTPPGGGPPPHSHKNEDEWFHVLEGRASFLANGKWTEVSPGSTAFLPKGSVHTFKNVGETPLKMVIHTAPSGFETFFARSAEEFNKPGGPDLARILDIAAEHGIDFVKP